MFGYRGLEGIFHQRGVTKFSGGLRNILEIPSDPGYVKLYDRSLTSPIITKICTGK